MPQSVQTDPAPLAERPASAVVCWQCDAPVDAAPVCVVCGVVQAPAPLDAFQRLGISVAARVDGELLRDRRLTLLAQVHPDRFAGHGEIARRFALAQAVAINDAARVLQDPRRRAEAMLAHRGWSTAWRHLKPRDQLRLHEYRAAIHELRGSDAHTERQALEQAIVHDIEAAQDVLFDAVNGRRAVEPVDAETEATQPPEDAETIAQSALACVRALRTALDELTALDTTPDRAGRVRK